MTEHPHPILTKNFKFQIWPGHGKMTDPQKFKFQIWPGHGKMTDLLQILNFRFGLDIAMMTNLLPPPSPKILISDLVRIWKDD